MRGWLFPQTLINIRLGADDDWNAYRTLAAEQEALPRGLSDSGRVLIRASGTESLLRVMVEGATPTSSVAAPSASRARRAPDTARRPLQERSPRRPAARRYDRRMKSRIDRVAPDA